MHHSRGKVFLLHMNKHWESARNQVVTRRSGKVCHSHLGHWLTLPCVLPPWTPSQRNLNEFNVMASSPLHHWQSNQTQTAHTIYDLQDWNSIMYWAICIEGQVTYLAWFCWQASATPKICSSWQTCCTCWRMGLKHVKLLLGFPPMVAIKFCWFWKD